MKDSNYFADPIAIAPGKCFDELPDEYQASVRKTYYDRSPWASIEVLSNGRCLVLKHPTNTRIPCPTWDAAVSQRNELVQTYTQLERAFH